MTFQWAKGSVEVVQDIEVIMPIDSANTVPVGQLVLKALQAIQEVVGRVSDMRESKGALALWISVPHSMHQLPERTVPAVLEMLRHIPVSHSTYLLTHPDNTQDIPVFEEIA